MDIECTLCWRREDGATEFHAIPNNVSVYVCDPCWQEYGGDEQAIREALQKALRVG